MINRIRIISLAVCCIVILTALTGCTKISTESVDDYGKFFDKKYVTFGSFDVFPKELSDSATVNSYIFDYAEMPISGANAQVFLDVTYGTKEDFEKEEKRIKAIDHAYLIYEDMSKMETVIEGNITFSVPETEIYFDETTFSYPAYITLFDEKRAYEYVFIFEDERRIVSVYLEFCPEEDVKFDKQYLPKEYVCLPF